MIKVKNLVGGYLNTTIINELDFEVQKGEFFALLGPNGSGKTTLFKLITGQLPIKKGEILVDDKQIASLSNIEKAKKMAVLTQEVNVSFDYTVEEIVSLGRFPHQKGFLKRLTPKDQQIVEEVMEITKITRYRKTPFTMISGGEKQRVLLAKVLAQQPEILLLDEPTNHLDIKHTFQMLDLLKEWQLSKGMTIFAILHDLNVASLYADRLALLENGTFLEVGDVNTLRKEDQLKKIYEVEVKTQAHPTIPKPQLLMTPKYTKVHKSIDFTRSLHLEKNSEYIHVYSEKPLRTISNGVIGEGINWLQHFCFFHVEKHYNNKRPQDDLVKWMKKLNIPPELAAGMMTAVHLEDVVVLPKQVGDVTLTVVVTAGTGNAVDITNGVYSEAEEMVGTINTMVFIDANFTDGALVNSFMSATEAKVKALQALTIKDRETNTIATGTSTDALLIAVSQQGEKTSFAGSGTIVGKAIGEAVYQATEEALLNYLNRLKKWNPK